MEPQALFVICLLFPVVWGAAVGMVLRLGKAVARD